MALSYIYIQISVNCERDKPVFQHSGPNKDTELYTDTEPVVLAPSVAVKMAV